MAFQRGKTTIGVMTGVAWRLIALATDFNERIAPTKVEPEGLWLGASNSIHAGRMSLPGPSLRFKSSVDEGSVSRIAAYRELAQLSK
jgi:hypothetical protein